MLNLLHIRLAPGQLEAVINSSDHKAHVILNVVELPGDNENTV